MSKSEVRAKKAMEVSDKEFEAQLLAGSTPATAEGSKRVMLETIQDMFGGDDLVKIKNFTDTKTGWVYSDKKSVRIEQPNEFTRRVWQGEQKARVLKAGETVIVPGWEAYVGLVRFYKQWIQEAGDLTLMNSPAKQAEFLSKAYAGLYDPNEGVAKATPEEVEPDVKAEVEDDLGLKSEKEA